MAILKVVNVRVGKNANLKGIINYVLQPQKTEEKLTTGICCDVPKAFETFMDTKIDFGKLSGRQYYHWVQSFPSNENITAQQAHELAIKFIESCKKFRGFEILVVTHKDREHIHTHFIMNSVSFIDGHKFHITRQELAELKEMQNKICIAHGFSAAPKKGFDMWGNKRVAVTANNARTYRLLQKSLTKENDSYLIRCYKAIKEAIRISESKQQFIQMMENQGFKTEWKDNKKHITFIDEKLKKQGVKKCKTRLLKLSQYFPEFKNIKTKEDLIYGIETGLYRAKDNSNRRAAGGDSGLIDFNTKFEQYSAKIDRERIERTAEETSRHKQENSKRTRIKITFGNGTSQKTNESSGRPMQTNLRTDSAKNRNAGNSPTERSPKGHRR